MKCVNPNCTACALCPLCEVCAEDCEYAESYAQYEEMLRQENDAYLNQLGDEAFCH